MPLLAEQLRYRVWVVPGMCNHLHLCKVDVNSLCTCFTQVKMTAQCERQWRIKLIMTAKCLSRVWWRPTESHGIQWSAGKQMSAAVLGAYFPSLCQQCLLFAVEFIRVCPADHKSAAVWMQQACLLQLPLALLLGSSCSRKPVLPPGLEDVWLWNPFMGTIKPCLGDLAWFRACFLLWVKLLIQKPSSSTSEIVQVLLLLFVILPPKAAQELRSARAFKGNFTFYELLDRTE